MKIGIRTGYASMDDFRKKTALYARCGIEAVELGPEVFGHGSPGDIDAILKSNGLGVSAIVGSISLITPDRVKREAGVALDIERLGICSELGASGLIEVPIFGTNPYPDMSPVVDRWGLERDLLVAQCKRIAPEAEKRGVNLLLEPLNRYETHFLNRVDQGLDIVHRTGSSAVKIMPDFFHMNIEEASFAEALRSGGSHIGYVHLADSSRKQPGTGHTDFLPGFRALREIGYDGYLVLECGFEGELEEALRTAVGLVRTWWNEAGTAM